MYIPGQLSLAALVSLVSSHLYPSLSSSSQHPGHPHAAAVLSPWEGGIQPTDLTSSQGLSLFSDWRDGRLTIIRSANTSSKSFPEDVDDQDETTFPTRSASFSPRLSNATSNPNPLRGRLRFINDFPAPNSSVVISPYGCPSRRVRSSPPPSELPPSRDIALLLRGRCSFIDKVLYAQSLGAAAAVVGDDVEFEGETDEEGRKRTSLITMFSTEAGIDVWIPAVYISRRAYLALRDEDATRPGKVLVALSQDDGWEWPLLDLLLLLLLLPSLLTLSTLAVHHARSINKRRKARAPDSVVEALPSRIWSKYGWEKDDSSSGGSCASSTRSRRSVDLEAGHGHENTSGASVSPRPAIATAAEQEQTNAEASSSSTPSSFHAAGSPASPHPRTVVGLHLPHLPNLPAKFKKKTKKKAVPSRPHAYFSTDECSICLEDFVNGDEVRVLPCGHIFHKHEIDAWLKGFQRLCPTCKTDISKPPPHPASGHGHAHSTGRARRNQAPPRPAPVTETTPLLSGGTGAGGAGSRPPTTGATAETEVVNVEEGVERSVTSAGR